MQVNVGMFGQKILNPLGLVRREVVGDHMDLLASGLVRHEVSEEGHELLRGVACSRPAQDLSALRVEGGIERQRAVAVILEAVALEAPRRQRKNGVQAVQSLDGCLFIDTEDRGVLRRIQVEPEDIRSLALEVRVVGGHVALNPVRLDTRALPRTGHCHVWQYHRLGEPADAPVRRTIGRLALRPGQDASFQPWRQHLGDAATVVRVQPSEAALEKPRLPVADKSRTARQNRAHLIVGPPVGQQQEQTRHLDLSSPRHAAPHPPRQLVPFGIRQLQRLGSHASEYTTNSSGTDH